MEKDETRYFTRQEVSELLGSEVSLTKTLNDVGYRVTPSGTKGKVTHFERCECEASFMVAVTWFRESDGRNAVRFYSKDAFEKNVQVMGSDNQWNENLR